MRSRVLTFVLSASTLALFLPALAAPPAAADGGSGTVYVGTTVGNNTGCASPGATSVEAAVQAAPNNGTVYLCGTVPYQETVLISGKNLTLTGDPGATLEAPATAAADLAPGTFFSSQGLQTPYAVLTIVGSGNVQVNGLTIEGPFANGGCGGQDYGILVLGGRAQLTNDQVLNIGASDQVDLGGCQYGVAIEVGSEFWNNTNQTAFVSSNFVATAQIQNDYVSGYQKNGVTVDGPGSAAQVWLNTIDGGGLNPIIGRNGVQISDGATAQIYRNSINNNEYTGTGYDGSSTGVLVFGGCQNYGYGPLVTNVQIHNNTFVNDDVAVDLFNADPTCSFAPTTPTNNRVFNNTISKNDGVTDLAYTPAGSGSTLVGDVFNGYQVGIADTGNGDVIHNNVISSSDGAYGPSAIPNGPYLAPIDTQLFPPVNVDVHNNTYNGAPTNATH